MRREDLELAERGDPHLHARAAHLVADDPFLDDAPALVRGLLAAGARVHLPAERFEGAAHELEGEWVVVDDDDAASADTGGITGPALRQQPRHGREEVVTTHGLDEVLRCPQGESAAALRLDADDDGHVGGRGVGLELVEHLPAVHARQVDVEHHGDRLLRPDQLEPLLARRGSQRVQPGGAEVQLDQLGGPRVVLDDDHDRSGHPCVLEHPRVLVAGCLGPPGLRERDAERAALPRGARHPEPSTVQLDDAAADGEPKAGALAG